MPLESKDKEFIKEVFVNFKDKALNPNDGFYQPIFDNTKMDDPASIMNGYIYLNDDESIQLFSGFRGSGKTTELMRLSGLLEEDGFLVIYADALNYISTSESIEITELILTLAGAFNDFLINSLGFNYGKENFWDKILNFLKLEVELKDIKIKSECKLGNDIIGNLKTGSELKFEIKENITFRKKVHELMEGNLNVIKKEVDSFFEGGINRIKREHGQNKKIVFIFDQLEQIRGSVEYEDTVIKSIGRIFSDYDNLLRIRNVHMVFTVPPWLKFFLSPEKIKINMLSALPLWNNDENRTKNTEIVSIFEELIYRRMNKQNCLRFFGENYHNFIYEIIMASGGHIRDLLRIFSDLFTRSLSGNVLPISEKIFYAAIANAKADFLPIAVNDAAWLKKISIEKKSIIPELDSINANKFSRFLDNHMVMYFMYENIEWYDVHPLIIGELDDL